MRREVEVKVRIADPGVLVKNLEKLGVKLSTPITQHDTIFVDDNYGNFADFQPGKNLLRIRKTDHEAVFTVKQPVSNEGDAIEHETIVSDPTELREVVNMLGYYPMAEVHKTRRKGKYKDYEICVDEVEGLGSYIEAEKITDAEDAEKVQEELLVFLESLGVSRQGREMHGYDTLMHMKENITHS